MSKACTLLFGKIPNNAKLHLCNIRHANYYVTDEGKTNDNK